MQEQNRNSSLTPLGKTNIGMSFRGYSRGNPGIYLIKNYIF